MKKVLIAGCSAVLLSTPSLANSEDSIKFPGTFSANVALVSDYVFRGITQSDEGPAIQGGVDYNLDLFDNLGLYLGTWASNVDFNDSSEASSEFDWYGGFTYSRNNFSLDVGAIYYSYPNAADSLNYDFWEGKASIGYDLKFASVAASVNISPENFGDSGDAEYYQLSAEVPLPNGFTLDGHIGRQNVEDNTTFGNPDYTDWSLGLAYTFKDLDLKIQYIDTDLSSRDCTDGCDAKAVFSVSKSF